MHSFLTLTLIVTAVFVCAAEVQFSEQSKSHIFWSTWSPWSSCTVTCGLGRKVRRRHCTPAHSAACQSAETTQSEICVQQPCNSDNRGPDVAAFLGQPASLQCPLKSQVGVKQLYWITPLGDMISMESVTNSGFKADGQQLDVLEASEYSSGTYHCVITDRNDDTDTGDVKLVLYACGHVNPCKHGGKCRTKQLSADTGAGSSAAQAQTSVKTWCECRFGYYGSFCQKELVNTTTIVVGSMLLVALLLAIAFCCKLAFWPSKAPVPLPDSGVSRPEPEGAVNIPDDQPMTSLPKDLLTDDEFFYAAEDELVQQPSVVDTRLPTVMPARASAADAEEARPLLRAADVQEPPPLQRPASRRRRFTDTDGDSYVDSDLDYPLTKAALRRMRSARRERAGSSTDDDGRWMAAGDSGRRFPPLSKTLTPESTTSGAGDWPSSVTPGRTSTSTFLYDSGSSNSDDVDVQRMLTMRAITRMQRQFVRKLPSTAINEAVISPDTGGISTPLAVTTSARSTRSGSRASRVSQARTRSRSTSITPRAISAGETSSPAAASVQIADDDLQHSLLKVEQTDTDGRKSTVYKLSPSPTAPTPTPSRPPSGRTSAPRSADEATAQAETPRPPSQAAPSSRPRTPSTSASPAGQTSPALADVQPQVPTVAQTPAATIPPAPSSATTSVQIPIDSMKSVQKMERTDAEGRKTTVYKLAPNAGSMFPAPIWPSFGGSGGSVGNTGRQVPVTNASIKLGDNKVPSTDAAAPPLSGAVVPVEPKRPDDSGSNPETVARLRSLASQRGETLSQQTLKEIQGVSARPQVRSVGATSFQQSLAAIPELDVPSDEFQSLAESRLSYAPARTAEPQSLLGESGSSLAITDAEVTQPFDGQSGSRFFSRDFTKPLGAASSLSNFPYLSGDHSFMDPDQRLTLGITVPDAANAANKTTRQFLEDRFNSQRKCFKGLTGGMPQPYLSGIALDGLQPETRSLLNRISSVRVNPPPQPSVSSVDRIRASFSQSHDRLLPASSDIPEEPSLSKMDRAGRRFHYDMARHDDALHPSFSKLAPTPAAEDMAVPDEYSHPSLSKIAPQRPHDSFISATADDIQHPSLTKLPVPAPPVPALPDNFLSPSDNKFSTARKVTFAARASEPAKLDDHLHPSLTRLPKYKGTGDRRSEFEETTTTTTVVDREFVPFDEPARPDDMLLHPSSNRLAGAQTRVANRATSAANLGRPSLAASIPARPDDLLHPSITRIQPEKAAATDRKESALTTEPGSAAFVRETTATSTTGLQKRGSSMLHMPAREDDVLRPSTTRMPATDSARRTFESATSTTGLRQQDSTPPVSARPVDAVHPSLTRISARESVRSGFDGATSTTGLRRTDSVRLVEARPDDAIHPSSTHVTAVRRTVDDITSTTGLRNVQSVVPVMPARPDDIVRPSSTRFPSRDSARATVEDTTSTTGLRRMEPMVPVSAGPDDIIHPSSTRFPSPSAVATANDTTSTTGLRRMESTVPVSARPDDIIHPSSTRFPPPSTARATADDTTSTSGLRRMKSTVPVSARPDDIIHPSSTRFPSPSTARATADDTTSTSGLRRMESTVPVSARPDDIIHPSSTRFPSPSAARATADDTNSTSGLRRMESAVPVSTRPDDIIHPSATRVSAAEYARVSTDDATSTTGLRRMDSVVPVAARPDDIIHPSSTRFQSRDSARPIVDDRTSTTGLRRLESTLHVPARPDDVMHPSSAHFQSRDTRVTRPTTDDATSAIDLRKMPVEARPDDYIHPSSTRFAGDVRATVDDATSTAGLKMTQSTIPVAARPDDIIHPSSFRFPSTVPQGGRTTVDDATSMTGMRRVESTMPVSARPDDIIHPSSTRVPGRPTTDDRTSTTGLRRMESAVPISARPDDIIHPSNTRFQSRDSARAGIDDTTSISGLRTTESTLPVSTTSGDRRSSQFSDDVGNIRLTYDDTTSTTGLRRMDSMAPVTARPDDLIHPSSTRFQLSNNARAGVDGNRVSATLVSPRSHEFSYDRNEQFADSDRTNRVTFDDATSTTGLSRMNSMMPMPARPDDLTHPSSTRFETRGNARATMDNATSTVGLRNNESSLPAYSWSEDNRFLFTTGFPAISDRSAFESIASTTDLDRTASVRRPSEPIPNRSSASVENSATSTTGLQRMGPSTTISARPDDIIHPSGTRVPSVRSPRSSFEMGTSTTGLPQRQDMYSGRSQSYFDNTATSTTGLPVSSRPSSDDQLVRMSAADRARSTFENSTSTTGLAREQSVLSPRAGDLYPMPARFQTGADVPIARNNRMTSTTGLSKWEPSLPALPEADYASSRGSSASLATSTVNLGGSRSMPGRPTDPGTAAVQYAPSHLSSTDVQSPDIQQMSSGYDDDIHRSASRRTAGGAASWLDGDSAAQFSMSISPPHVADEVPYSSEQSIQAQRASAAVDPQKTVTWSLQRARSNVDAHYVESISDSSVGRRSLPGMASRTSRDIRTIPDLGSSANAATYRSMSTVAAAPTASDVPIEYRIDARDSRVVTREHLVKKRLEDYAAGSEYRHRESASSSFGRLEIANSEAANADVPELPSDDRQRGRASLASSRLSRGEREQESAGEDFPELPSDHVRDPLQQTRVSRDRLLSQTYDEPSAEDLPELPSDNRQPVRSSAVDSGFSRGSLQQTRVSRDRLLSQTFGEPSAEDLPELPSDNRQPVRSSAIDSRFSRGSRGGLLDDTDDEGAAADVPQQPSDDRKSSVSAADRCDAQCDPSTQSDSRGRASFAPSVGQTQQGGSITRPYASLAAGYYRAYPVDTANLPTTNVRSSTARDACRTAGSTTCFGGPGYRSLATSADLQFYHSPFAARGAAGAPYRQSTSTHSEPPCDARPSQPCTVQQGPSRARSAGQAADRSMQASRSVRFQRDDDDHDDACDAKPPDPPC